MSYSMILKDSLGNQTQFDKCVSFLFKKEVYTPYTYLVAEFDTVRYKLQNICEVIFKIAGNTIHQGFVDSLVFNYSGSRITAKIVSKGFTSLLCQNELEPGLKYNVSLGSLVSEFIEIPYLTYESNSQTVNYIYVKENSSLWDSVGNLSYKLTGNFPYIQGTNCVRMTPISSNTKTIPMKGLLRCGTSNDYTKMVSSLHMQDVDGNYNTYNKSNAQAVLRNIIRHKQIPLDRQYLNDPENGLDYKLNYSNRGFYCCWGECPGYTGEDLNDTISIANLADSKRISLLEIRGRAGYVKTKYGVYFDSFNNI